MGLFGKKEPQPTGIVGVDIGAGGIKAVELKKENGRMRLLTYGYSTMTNPDDMEHPLRDDPKKAAKILNDIYKKSGMKSTRANASLPSQSIFHAIITIPTPKSAKDDLKPMIENQVVKLLPRALDEMVLDSMVIDKDRLPQATKAEKKKKAKEAAAEPIVTSDSKHIRVLVSGAPKDLVNRYVEIFKYAKLQLVSLETEAFALIRSLIGKDKARIMVVDIGYERTNITIVQQGIPFLHRSIKAGGAEVTAMIAKQMGVTPQEAEQTKADLALTSEGDLPPVLKQAVQPILHEIKYSLQLYAQQDFHSNTSVEKIIITGGAAHLPQIDTYLTSALNINVYLGDPWARVATPSGLRPVLDEIGPSYSVAIGLAMKDLDQK